MENIKEATIISSGSRLYTATLNSSYHEFIRLKPDYNVLGEIFLSLLQDAVTSLVKSSAKMYDNAVLYDNTDIIVSLTVKYARLYFTLNREETALLMLRATIYDIIRGYDYDNKKYDNIATNMYESIRKLITV